MFLYVLMTTKVPTMGAKMKYLKSQQYCFEDLYPTGFT